MAGGFLRSPSNNQDGESRGGGKTSITLAWEFYAVPTKDAMVHRFVDAGFCEPIL